MDYWDSSTNTETGKYFEEFRKYLESADDGEADIERFIHSPYGDEFSRRINRYYTWHDKAMSEEVLEYYQSLGLKKELFETDDYFTRWVIFSPLHPEAGRTYPLVFLHHGGNGHIECEEFYSNFPQLAAEKGFMLAILQNTNAGNTLRILDIIKENYPLDESRVYVTGYSQGGIKTTAVVNKCPERFAAMGPAGNGILDANFGEDDFSKLETTLVPFIQVVGANEFRKFVPMNFFLPRDKWKQLGKGDPVAPVYPREMDPTQVDRPAFLFRPDMTDTEKLEALNKRLALLGCAPRDIERCMQLKNSDNELQRVLGFYGDEEEIRIYYGIKYYISTIFNSEGRPVFRFVAVENQPHWIPLMMAELEWEFFSMFHR